MLVLARQLHERLLIPVIDTCIEVVSVRASQVRLGIEAPATVAVLREELCRRASEETPPLRLKESALLRRLRHLLRDLSELQQQTSLLPRPALFAAVEKIREEVAQLSRQVETLLEASSPAVDPPLVSRA